MLASQVILPLSWDTEFFGFPVARNAPGTRRDDVDAGLALAVREGYRLVYWFSSTEEMDSPLSAASHKPSLVSQHLRFCKDLNGIQRQPVLPADYQISVYPQQAPEPGLGRLAILAGRYSRFALDPRVPRERFVSLYETWLRKSTTRELAETVLVCRNRANEVAGFVTAATSSPIGFQVGLIAVGEEHQRRGLAACLLGEVERDALARGHHVVEVITQAINQEARRLYQACGYRIAADTTIEHFWFEAESGK